MSTKTTFKRVALVAVAALGMGVLTSVSPASAGNLANATLRYTLSTTVSSTNYGVVSATNPTAAAGSAEILPSSSVVFTQVTNGETLGTAVADFQKFAISGDATWDTWSKDADSGTVSISQDRKTLSVSGGNPVTALDSVTLKNSAATSGTITVTHSAKVSGTALTSVVYTIVVIPTAAATAVDTYSAAKSNVQITFDGVAVGTVNTDESGANIASNGGDVQTVVSLVDAYGGNLSNGSLIATVTGGLYAAWDANAAVGVQAVKTGRSGVVHVTQGTANVGGTGTLTITYNGVVVGTKSVTILGDLATITVTPKKIGASTAATTAGVGVALADASGKAIKSSAYTISLDTTVPSTVVTSYTNETNSVVINNTSGETSSATVVAGLGKLQCGATPGTATGLKLKATNTAGVVIYSAPFNFSCAGAVASVTVAFDKATYKAGEVAVLTVTSKDALGNVANDVTAQGAVTVSSGAFTTDTSGNPVGGAATGTTVNGIATYKFVVGQTAGNYTAVVTVPGASTTKTATAAVSVTSAGASEIAQLVKVIGTLLTTFTKQIAALIKALGKR